MDRCVPFILASALVVLTFGCSETMTVDDPIPQPFNTQSLTGNIVTEQFTIGPEGGHVTALGETVCLDFPEDAVTKPTLFTITSHPLHQLDHYDLTLMDRGVSLEMAGIDKGFAQMVKIRMKYDFSSQKGAQVEEENLTIFTVYGNYFRFPNIYPIGECCVDCECQTVIGCICETGTYVVGVN